MDGLSVKSGEMALAAGRASDSEEVARWSVTALPVAWKSGDAPSDLGSADEKATESDGRELRPAVGRGLADSTPEKAAAVPAAAGSTAAFADTDIDVAGMTQLEAELRIQAGMVAGIVAVTEAVGTTEVEVANTSSGRHQVSSD